MSGGVVTAPISLHLLNATALAAMPTARLLATLLALPAAHAYAQLPAAARGADSPVVRASRRVDAVTASLGSEPLLRIGHGYDIHRMAPREEAGQPLVISGVSFDGSDAPDFELGCIAHSDGDVVYHSVVDAILGALTLPDIGQLFPDNDPRLRGANSEIFMFEAYKRMRERGYLIGNVDVTLIAQRPRVNVRAVASLSPQCTRLNTDRVP